jgi:hypothetical protein
MITAKPINNKTKKRNKQVSLLDCQAYRAPTIVRRPNLSITKQKKDKQVSLIDCQLYRAPTIVRRPNLSITKQKKEINRYPYLIGRHIVRPQLSQKNIHKKNENKANP